MAGTTFPNLADLVAADLYAGNAIWRMPEVDTVVLRLVYSLGSSQRGTLANFLRGTPGAHGHGFRSPLSLHA